MTGGRLCARLLTSLLVLAAGMSAAAPPVWTWQAGRLTQIEEVKPKVLRALPASTPVAMQGDGSGGAWIVDRGQVLHYTERGLIAARLKLTELGFERLDSLRADARSGGAWLANRDRLIYLGGDGRIQGAVSPRDEILDIATALDGSVWVLHQTVAVHHRLANSKLEIDSSVALPALNVSPRRLLVDSLGKRLWLLSEQRTDPKVPHAESRGPGTTLVTVDSGGDVSRQELDVTVQDWFIDQKTGDVWLADGKGLTAYAAGDQAGIHKRLRKDGVAGPVVLDPSGDFVWAATSNGMAKLSTRDGSRLDIDLGSSARLIGTSPLSVLPALTLRAPKSGTSLSSGDDLALEVLSLCNGVPCDLPRHRAGVGIEAVLGGKSLGPFAKSAESGVMVAFVPSLPSFGAVHLSAHAIDALGQQSKELEANFDAFDRSGASASSSSLTRLSPGNMAGSGASASATAVQPSAQSISPAAAPSVGSGAEGRFANLPLSFEMNRGQHDASVKFSARTQGMHLFLTGNETVFSLRRLSTPDALDARSEADPFAGQGELRPESAKRATRETRDREAPRKPTRAELKFQAVGAHDNAVASGEGATAERSHYLRGNDPAKWYADVPHFQRVRFSNVYQGIDKVYHANDGVLEYDWIIAPGVDPAVIRQRIVGAEDVQVDADANLVITLGGSKLIQKRPVAYQEAAAGSGARTPVVASYVLSKREGNVEVTFELGTYDRSRALVIDPVIQFASYLGGTGNDGAEAVRFDAAGYVLVAGWTESTDFPTLNAVQPGKGDSGAGWTDGFVAKFTGDGRTRLFTTYLGGSRYDRVTSLAVRSDGIYVAGSTESANFPTTVGAYDTVLSSSPNPHTDGFVAKLSTTGSSFVYSTYLGGNVSGYSGTEIRALALDTSGNAIVAGYTASTQHPVTAGALQTSPRTGFVTKLNTTGTALVYSTYLGGTGQDIPNALAVDSAGNAFLTGIVHSDNFPTTAGAFQTVRKGGADAFLLKLNATGSALLYSTLFGGGELNWNSLHPTWSDWTGFEQGTGIAIDTSGNAYIVGQTSSTDMPLGGTPYQNTLKSIQIRNGGTGQVWNGDNAFYAKFNTTGTALLQSTYFGGLASPNCNLSTFPFDHNPAHAIAVDSVGNVAIGGATLSPSFPLKDDNSAVDLRRNSPSSINYNSYVAEFAPSGALNYSNIVDEKSSVNALSYYREGEVAVAGTSSGHALRTDMSTVFQTTAKGGMEAFFARYSSKAVPPYRLLLKAERSPSFVGDDTIFFVTISGLTAPAGGQFEFCDGTYCRKLFNTSITGDGTYQFQFSDLPVGIRSLKVNYSGYSFNPPLTSNVLAHEVKAYSTTPVTLTLTASAAEVTTQDMVQLKATFGSTVYWGAIEWFDNGVLAFRSELGPAPPTPVYLTVATAGAHNYQAKFTGSGWGAPASSNIVTVTARNDRTLSRLFIASPIDGSRIAATPSGFGMVPIVINGSVPAGDRVSFMWLTLTRDGVAQPEQKVCGPNDTYTYNSCSVLVPGGFSFAVPTAFIYNRDPGTYTLQAKIQYSATVMQSTPVTVSVMRASGPGETNTYLHSDAAGSPIAATNQSGALLWREGYRPYGLRAIKEPASSKNRQFFHGKPEDADTGLSYFGARYYDTLTGRFMGVDPKVFDERNVHSFNRFAYGNLNPNKFGDPDGRAAALLLEGAGVLMIGGIYYATRSTEEKAQIRQAIGTYFDNVFSSSSKSKGKAPDRPAADTGGTPGGGCGEEHHICTDKNEKSKARGGPWTPRFRELFDKAEMSLNDAENIVRVQGHAGPHPEAYHTYVYRYLQGRTAGLQGEEYAAALRAGLRELGNEMATPGTPLNKLIAPP